MTLHPGDVVQLDHSVPQVGDLYMVVLRAIPSRQEVQGRVPGHDGIVSCNYGNVRPAGLQLHSDCNLCMGVRAKCEDCDKHPL